jgi:hypothetical protein
MLLQCTMLQPNRLPNAAVTDSRIARKLDAKTYKVCDKVASQSLFLSNTRQIYASCNPMALPCLICTAWSK